MNPGVGDGGAPAETTRLDELERRIAALPDQLQATWVQDLERLQRSLTAHVQTLAARVEKVLAALGADPAAVAAVAIPPGADDLSDEFYSALESRFRGSTDEIGARQQAYVADVRALASKAPVLDLGCGRGEFLHLLRHAGVDAIGIDTSEVAVAECRAAGLEARRADLVEELKGWPASSVCAVSLLQVVEHLPFGVLLSVLNEAHRVLQPGGLLLVETPNGANLSVAASTFWLDPTHVRPIHPLLLEFIVERAGFTNLELRGSASSSPEWRLADDAPASPQDDAIRGLQALLLDDQDVTLRAHVED